MISAWWLILIVPVTFTAGYVLCGIMASGAQDDKCSSCMYEQSKKS